MNKTAVLYLVGTIIEIALAVHAFSTGRTNNAILATVAAICFLLTAILEKGRSD